VPRKIAAIMEYPQNFQTLSADPESQKMPRLPHGFTRHPVPAKSKMIQKDIRRQAGAD